jgi:primosomal replication protein N
LALGFATEMFRTWLKYSNIRDIKKSLTANGMEGKLMVGTQVQVATFVTQHHEMSHLGEF